MLIKKYKNIKLKNKTKRSHLPGSSSELCTHCLSKYLLSPPARSSADSKGDAVPETIPARTTHCSNSHRNEHDKELWYQKSFPYFSPGLGAQCAPVGSSRAVGLLRQVAHLTKSGLQGIPCTAFTLKTSSLPHLGPRTWGPWQRAGTPAHRHGGLGFRSTRTLSDAHPEGPVKPPAVLVCHRPGPQTVNKVPLGREWGSWQERCTVRLAHSVPMSQTLHLL